MVVRAGGKRDLILVLLWPIVAAVVSLLFKLNYLEGALIFMGVPVVYLSVKDVRAAEKAALFAIPLGVIFTLLLEYVMAASNELFIPQSAFGSFRFFGFATLDSLIWGVLYLFLIVIYYEYFIDHHAEEHLKGPHFRLLFIVLSFFLGALVLILLFQPAIQIPYFYAIWGLILVLVPVVLMLFEFPKLYAKFFKAAAYFWYFSFIYEVTAIHLGHWVFPESTTFLGWVFIGGIAFPFEELFYFIFLGSLAVLSYFQFFDN